MKRTHYILLLVTLILLLDQTLKIWVKLNMPLGDYFEVADQAWFQINFIENPGMAFGIEWGGAYGKLALSLFRLVAIGFIGFLLFKLVRQQASYLVITSITLIFSGAVGNMLDSMFYGLLFTESTALEVANWAGGDQMGYANFLHGRVVDMFYFPLLDTTFPEWLPSIGGRPFQFFEFIFNIADAAVFIGTSLIFVGYKHFFNAPTQKDTPNVDPSQDASEHLSISK